MFPPLRVIGWLRRVMLPMFGVLQELKEEFSQTTQPDYEQCLSTGQELMVHCGEPDKPEVKKNIEDLDHAWGNITQLFLQRDTDLVEAMEKSMAFHGLLQSLLSFLEAGEDRLANMGSIGAETEAVKRQMEHLKAFRAEMEPHTVDVESLITQVRTRIGIDDPLFSQLKFFNKKKPNIWSKWVGSVRFSVWFLGQVLPENTL